MIECTLARGSCGIHLVHWIGYRPSPASLPVQPLILHSPLSLSVKLTGSVCSILSPTALSQLGLLYWTASNFHNPWRYFRLLEMWFEPKLNSIIIIQRYSNHNKKWDVSTAQSNWYRHGLVGGCTYHTHWASVLPVDHKSTFIHWSRVKNLLRFQHLTSSPFKHAGCVRSIWDWLALIHGLAEVPVKTEKASRQSYKLTWALANPKSEYSTLLTSLHEGSILRQGLPQQDIESGWCFGAPPLT